MARNEENWRVAFNETNCADPKVEGEMPKECNVVSFGEDKKIIITNSGTRGIIPEELESGKPIIAKDVDEGR